MRRLLRLTLALVLFCAGVSFAATALARALPPPPYGAVFTFPDGTPCQRRCLFGARPGLTRYDDAVRLLEAHPLTRDLLQRDRLTVVGRIYEGAEMVVEIQGDARGILTQISLHIAPSITQRMRSLSAELPPLPESPLKGGTLGGTVAWLGSPAAVDLNGMRLVRVVYPDDGLTVLVKRGGVRLDPSNELSSIFMYSVPDPNLTPGYRWLGFKPFQTYYDSQLRR